MDEITAVTRDRGITVIEDCAHALGAVYDGRRPGSLGDIGCFSFHASKNITTLGEGGMITLDRDDWAERLDRLRSNEVDGEFASARHEGLVPGRELLPWMKYASPAYEQVCSEVRRPGTNATLSEAAAAVGLAQMERLDELVDRRREIAHAAGRGDHAAIRTPASSSRGPGCGTPSTSTPSSWTARPACARRWSAVSTSAVWRSSCATCRSICCRSGASGVMASGSARSPRNCGSASTSTYRASPGFPTVRSTIWWPLSKTFSAPK